LRLLGANRRDDVHFFSALLALLLTDAERHNCLGRDPLDGSRVSDERRPAELAVRRQQVAFSLRTAVRADEGRAGLGERFGGQTGEFGERVFPHGCAHGRHSLPVPAVAARHHPGGRIPGHGGPAVLARVYRRPARHVELPVAITILTDNDSSQGYF
jgi:hypothetical protein